LRVFVENVKKWLWYWNSIGHTEDSLIACNMSVCPTQKITFSLQKFLQVQPTAQITITSAHCYEAVTFHQHYLSTIGPEQNDMLSTASACLS